MTYAGGVNSGVYAIPPTFWQRLKARLTPRRRYDRTFRRILVAQIVLGLLSAAAWTMVAVLTLIEMGLL